MASRRTVLTGALLGTAAALLPGIAQAAPAPRLPELRLPAPTGPHPVGLRTVHLTDPSRTDPWAGGPREVMLTVLYPARTVRGCPRVPQLTPAAAQVFAELAPLVHPGLPAAGAVDWGAVLTHGHLDAPPLPGPWPVLLYSPGGGDSRTLGTLLAEDLAGHGRIVVLVDHPGDASQVELPSGIRVTALRGEPDPATFRTMIDTRVADLRLVLDHLPGLLSGLLPGHRPDLLSRHFPDAPAVGIYGHSAGGTAAVHTALRDRRVRAVANLEGYLDLDGLDPQGSLHDFDRPLLLLRTDGFDGAARIERSWAGIPGTRALLTGAGHWALTDYAALVPQLQSAGLVTPATRAALVGTADPAVTVAALRNRVGAFFAHRLPRPARLPQGPPGGLAGHRAGAQ
ncbi:acetylhydrolase [Streptomyces sp. NPDC101160]|uniref:acetylhydrolase n=1 Tax=Streptomyces sp. NPDC101160 TaxID=3366118 RepID=UPI003816B9D5